MDPNESAYRHHFIGLASGGIWASSGSAVATSSSAPPVSSALLTLFKFSTLPLMRKLGPHFARLDFAYANTCALKNGSWILPSQMRRA